MLKPILALLLLLVAASASADTFEPLPVPCRLADTRVNFNGPIPAGVRIDFKARETNAGLGQGGQYFCYVPQASSGMWVHITAVDPKGDGFVTAWGYGLEQPLISVLFTRAKVTVESMVYIHFGVLGVGAPDFSVVSPIATHYVVDVVAYTLPD